jgi:hypothetical protein
MAVVATPDNPESPSVTHVLAKRVPRPRVANSLLRNPFALDWLELPSLEEANQDEPVDDDGLEELALEFTLTRLDDGGPGLALISGRVVRPGEILGRYRVVRVAERYVVLQDGNEMVTLRMR